MKRKAIPLAVKLAVALRQLGLDPKTAILDHDPALWRRERTAAGGYIPDENDPAFLQWLGPAPNAEKTFGRGGEKRITTRDSDVGEFHRTNSIAKKEAAFKARVLAKGKPKGEAPRSKWGKRPLRGRGFQKRPTRPT